MMLRYTFNLGAEADAIENAVKQVLADGIRTGDIAKPGEKVYGTIETGRLIAEADQIAERSVAAEREVLAIVEEKIG